MKQQSEAAHERSSRKATLQYHQWETLSTDSSPNRLGDLQRALEKPCDKSVGIVGERRSHRAELAHLERLESHQRHSVSAGALSHLEACLVGKKYASLKHDERVDGP